MVWEKQTSHNWYVLRSSLYSETHTRKSIFDTFWPRRNCSLPPDIKIRCRGQCYCCPLHSRRTYMSIARVSPSQPRALISRCLSNYIKYRYYSIHKILSFPARELSPKVASRKNTAETLEQNKRLSAHRHDAANASTLETGIIVVYIEGIHTCYAPSCVPHRDVPYVNMAHQRTKRACKNKKKNSPLK